MNLAVIKLFLTKYQFLIFIIITIILTYQNLVLFSKIYQKSINSFDEKKIPTDTNLKNKKFNLQITNCQDININGNYLCLPNSYNDSFIFKHQINNYWIFKVDVIDENKKYLYWIISNSEPTNNSDNKILYETVNIVNIGRTEVWHYLDYGAFPVGIFYNPNNRSDYLNVKLN